MNVLSCLNQLFGTFLALPKPVGLFPLDKTFGGKDVVNQENVVLKNVQLTTGPDGMDKFILCLVKRMIYSCYNSV